MHKHSSWRNTLLACMAPQFRSAYILLLCLFFLSFFWSLISEVTERISTKRDIHLWLLFENFGLNSPWHLHPMGLEAKTAFWGLTLNFDWTYLCNGTCYQQSEEKWTPLHAPPNLLNFGPEKAKNGWRVSSFSTPPNFSHWETLPALWHGRYMSDCRQTLARVVAWAYSLEQQNAGQAYAGLCHASSCLLNTTEVKTESTQSLMASCRKKYSSCLQYDE